MKKKLVALIMATVMATVLVACGTGNSTADTKQETTSVSEKDTKDTDKKDDTKKEDSKKKETEKEKAEADKKKEEDKKKVEAEKESEKKLASVDNKKETAKTENKDNNAQKPNTGNNNSSKPENKPSNNSNNNKPSTPSQPENKPTPTPEPEQPSKPSGGNSNSGSVNKPSKPVEKPSEPQKPAPHVHNYNTVVSSTNGDCSHVGKVTKKCSCGKTVTENGSYGDHKWENQYKEVHHDAKYEERPVYKWVGYHECRKCGFQTEDDDAILLHCFDCGGTYTTKEKQVQTGTESVQVEKAWTEQVPDGKKCTICGTHNH